MIKDNSYFYTIDEVVVNRKSDPIGKDPHQYLRLSIKHRLKNTTLVVFTKSFPIGHPNAFQELLELASRLKATY